MNLQQSIRKRLNTDVQERQIHHSLWAKENGNNSNPLELLPPM
jgi:hypothetical protein